MASITIRNLDESIKRRLRIQAAHNERSMEEEARTILSDALSSQSSDDLDLADSIRRRFEPFGGLDLELPSREPVREPPEPGR
ncbi:MAG: plasmid stabilization protein [Acidobacteriota bacterium]